ncbi:MAG: hypothetical protein JOY82_19415 [Streptosporangiaceae bacterium]|nr:hypothetical protein [Streptosporangiaceae bacterium]MBV9856655.1 hypothetical protein [Streptosporangiaceae bacterium]
MADQVPSPMHQAIADALMYLEQNQAAIGGALGDACNRMNGGKVWVGSTATTWQDTLNGTSKDLSAQVALAISDVRASLAQWPPTCTQAEASQQAHYLNTGGAAAHAGPR